MLIKHALRNRSFLPNFLHISTPTGRMHIGSNRRGINLYVGNAHDNLSCRGASFNNKLPKRDQHASRRKRNIRDNHRKQRKCRILGNAQFRPERHRVPANVHDLQQYNLHDNPRFKQRNCMVHNREENPTSTTKPHNRIPQRIGALSVCYWLIEVGRRPEQQVW